MDFYEGSSIALDPKGYTRFDGQKRGHGGRAFQEERTDQPKQRCGVQRINGMFRGYEYPFGAGMWNILGGHWGAGGGDKTATVGGPRSCRS